MNNWLFPSSYRYSSAWTTSTSVDLPGVEHVKLTDDVLGVHRVSSRTTHPIVPAPDASNSQQLAWEAFYPNGSINPSAEIPGGFGFYLRGPEFFATQLSESNTVLLAYSVKFEKDWDWVKGGKLPGAFGGVGDSAYSCTGGRTHHRDTCFNLRLMWRPKGLGELYAYMPFNETNDSILLKVPPRSKQNPAYGISVGKGAFTFEAGRWTTVTQVVKLNDVGSTNGEIEMWINGQTAIKASGLLFRSSPDFAIQGLHFQTFFGGNGPEWASTKDQRAWFSDISGAIVSPRWLTVRRSAD